MKKSQEELESAQRAALMGLVSGIIGDTESTTIEELKKRVVSNVVAIVNLLTVGDLIEMLVMVDCKEYIEQEIALEEANEILTKNS